MREGRLSLCEDSRAQVLGLQFIKQVNANPEHCLTFIFMNMEGNELLSFSL